MPHLKGRERRVRFAMNEPTTCEGCKKAIDHVLTTIVMLEGGIPYETWLCGRCRYRLGTMDKERLEAIGITNLLMNVRKPDDVETVVVLPETQQGAPMDVLQDTAKAMARRIWEEALLSCKRYHCPREQTKYGPGYFITGTVASFIRSAWPNFNRDDAKMRQVESTAREILKATGNVVVVDRGEKRHNNRIFVRAEYNDAQAVIVNAASNGGGGGDRIDTVAKRLTAHEAGEDRKPEPVKVKKPPLTGPKAQIPRSPRAVLARATPLSSRQIDVVRYLATVGGRVVSKSGQVSRVVANGIGDKVVESMSDTLRSLEARGLVTIEGNARRYYTVTLTTEGRKTADSADKKGSGTEILRAWFQRNGSFAYDKKPGATTKLAEILDIAPNRVADATRALEEEGLLERRLKESGAFYVGFVWSGPRTSSTAVETKPEPETKSALVDTHTEQHKEQPVSAPASTERPSLRLADLFDQTDKYIASLEARITQLESELQEARGAANSETDAMFDLIRETAAAALETGEKPIKIALEEIADLVKDG